MGKHFSDEFPIQNYQKQGDTFQLCFRTHQQEGFELNGTHQQQVCALDLDLFG
jgi:hypothetical protein